MSLDLGMGTLDGILDSTLRLRDRVVDVLSNSPLGQHVTKRTDNLLASWRWNHQTLGYSIRVPIPTEFDHRHYLSLMVGGDHAAS
jgi:hypothetical protein